LKTKQERPQRRLLVIIIIIKNRFWAYLCQKWIDLRQTKTKMINGAFYSCRRTHFISENVYVSFCDIYL